MTPSGTPGDDSDHEDHVSVVTYKEDDDLFRQNITPNRQDEANKEETSVQGRNPVDNTAPREPKPEVRKDRLFVAKVLVGDICDSTFWEALFVIFCVAFIILTIAEVSIFFGPIGTLPGLQGLSATSASLLGVFTIEVLVKTFAFDMSFWRVPRNCVDSLAILVGFALQVTTTWAIFDRPNAFVSAQLTVASRVARLIVCILKQRRAREFYTAAQAMHSLKSGSLTTTERTLGILRELKSTYPLSGVHQIQLQWCINVIASHRLYAGLFHGPDGEPIKFEGVDEDTSKWLLGTYSQVREDLTTPSMPPSSKSDVNTEAQQPGEKSALSSSTPNMSREGRVSRQLHRRDTDGADALLAGRRHTPLYVSTEKLIGGSEPTESNAPFATQGNASPVVFKRGMSRSSLVTRSESQPKTSNLRRGSSLLNQFAEIATTDVEQGPPIISGSHLSQRILSSTSGITTSDLTALETLYKDETQFRIPFNSPQWERINRELDDWSFDVFVLDEITNGRPLSVGLVACLRKNNLLESLSPCISPGTIMEFIVEIERGYSLTNPYHTRVHAADVVQGFHHFTTHQQFRDSLTSFDRFLGLIAAAIHDYQHPGKNNAFLIATKDALAVQYNDISVLESFHVASAFQLMRSRPELDIFANLPSAGRLEARETVIQMVLATDMKAHFDVLSQFKSQVVAAQDIEKAPDNLGPWWNEAFPLDRDASFSSTASVSGVAMAYPLEHRRMILKTGLHVSDVSNPARPNPLAVRWADLVQEEFFQQGDAERALGLPVSMFMDRQKPAFPKSQVGFIEFIVKPLAESFYLWLRSLRPVLEQHLVENLEYWKKRQESESGVPIPSVSPGLPPPAPSNSPADTRTSARIMSRLKSGSSISRHKGTGSFNDTIPSNADSPSGPVGKRSGLLRRATSDALPSLVQEMAMKKRNASPVTLPAGTTTSVEEVIMPLDQTPALEKLGEASN